MAAATRGSIASSSEAHRSESASSIARRSTERLNAAMSATQLVDLEDAVGRFVQLLEPCFGRRQKRRCGAQLGNSLLEERERRVEVELLRLEPRRDLLEARHARFEAHAVPPTERSAGGGSTGTTCRTVTPAMPSRSTRSSSAPGSSA